MRLIDADKLKGEHPVVTFIVDEAPTVEAIPIPFIKEIIRVWESFASGYYEVTIRDFEWLIERWKYDTDLEKMKSELKKIEEDAFK